MKARQLALYSISSKKVKSSELILLGAEILEKVSDPIRKEGNLIAALSATTDSFISLSKEIKDYLVTPEFKKSYAETKLEYAQRKKSEVESAYNNFVTALQALIVCQNQSLKISQEFNSAATVINFDPIIAAYKGKVVEIKAMLDGKRKPTEVETSLLGLCNEYLESFQTAEKGAKEVQRLRSAFATSKQKIDIDRDTMLKGLGQLESLASAAIQSAKSTSTGAGKSPYAPGGQALMTGSAKPAATVAVGADTAAKPGKK